MNVGGGGEGVNVAGATGVSGSGIRGVVVGVEAPPVGAPAGVGVAVARDSSSVVEVGRAGAEVAWAVGKRVSLGIGSWSGAGLAVDLGVAVAPSRDTGVSAPPPQAAKSPAPPANNAVTKMDFRNLMLCGKVEVTKNLTRQHH